MTGENDPKSLQAEFRESQQYPMRQHHDLVSMRKMMGFIVKFLHGARSSFPRYITYLFALRHGIYLRSQVNRFIVLMHGRTGSTWLIQALNAHPRILANHEILIPVKSAGADAQIQCTRKFFSSALIAPHSVIGFKTKMTDILDPSNFMIELRRLQVKVILLRRRNLVKWVISELNRRKLSDLYGRHVIYDEKQRLEPLLIDIEEFSKRLIGKDRIQQSMEDFVSELGAPCLHIYYEDMFLSWDQTLRKICAFLEVPYIEVRGKSIKATNDDLRIAIRNFDELRRNYTGTGYEAMFDEVIMPGGFGQHSHSPHISAE